MAEYKLTNTTYVIRTADNAFIPTDESNRDYQDYLTWLAVPNTPDAADPDFKDTWPGVREKRDLLLSECDWTQLPDSPLDSTQKTNWSAYRESLRNIPQDYQNVADIVWPVKPS